MKTETKIIIGGTVAVLAYFLILKGLKAGREGIKEAGNLINPVSDKNIFYQGSGAVTQAITGDANASFGTWLYDVNADPTKEATEFALDRNPYEYIDDSTYIPDLQMPSIGVTGWLGQWIAEVDKRYNEASPFK